MSNPRDKRGRAAAPQSYLKALIADDDAATRKLVARFLSNSGVGSFEAANGEDALAVLKEHGERIGVVLLDVMMPKMGGFEVLARIKDDASLGSIPVLLLTAHANEDADVVHSIESGAEDHLKKPFRGAVLVAKVRALCNRRQATLALAERLKIAEAMAATDPLTGLGNRRAFDNQLRMEEAYVRRHREPIGLLMIDLDHFKAVNDAFGHPEGDRVICFTAESIRESLRVSDQGYRLGGEEFGVLLRGSDRAGAALVAERLRKGISTPDFEFGTGERRAITMSVGVAYVDASNDFDVVDLVARADHALYDAKHSGRNCVVIEARTSSVAEAQQS